VNWKCSQWHLNQSTISWDNFTKNNSSINETTSTLFVPFVGVSTPRVPRPTSKLSLHVPAQMGQRETEHKGGRNSKGKPRPSCCPAPRADALAVGGYKRSRGRERERERECQRFETGGSLGRRVKCRRVPQPRWVGARRSAKGENRQPERERERWKSRGLRVCPAPRSGALAVGGYKRPRGRGSERPHASACPVLFPARPTLSKRALVLPFIGARRGSRCTMGV
jgi:hypothetical protein